MIKMSIGKGVPSNDWVKQAVKLIKAEAEKLNISFEAAEAFVKLPESGRCFVKRAGDKGLVAYG